MATLTYDPAHVTLMPTALLARLLNPHEHELRGKGLAVDADPRTLLSTVLPDMLPATVVEALHHVEDMADAVGMEMILRNCPALLEVAAELDPRSFALLTFLEHRHGFLKACEFRRAETVQRFREFAGRTPGSSRNVSDADLTALSARLASVFATRGRLKACTVERLAEHRTQSFRIIYTRPLQYEETVEVREQEPLFACEAMPRPRRPPQRDLVIYDPRSGHLKVHAPDASALRVYREVFGELLFGDPAWFGTRPVVSLGPLLARGVESLLPTEGIRSVELVSLEIALPIGRRATLAIKGSSVFAILQSYPAIDMHYGTPVYAKLLVSLSAGGHARSVEIVPPWTIVHDRRKHDAVLRNFLEQRGFLAGAWQPVGEAK